MTPAPVEIVSKSPSDEALKEYPITIRRYQAADHAAVVKIFVDGIMLVADALDGDNRSQPLEYIEKSCQGDLADIEGFYMAKGGMFWVAVTQGEDGKEEVVGCVGLEKKRGNADAPKQGELLHMSVRGDQRRRGVGRMLIQELENWARVHKFDVIVLGTSNKQWYAIKFYEAFGYKEVERIPFSPEFYVLNFKKNLEQPEL